MKVLSWKFFLLVIVLIVIFFLCLKYNHVDTYQSPSKQFDIAYSLGRGPDGKLNSPQLLDLYQPASKPPNGGFHSVVYIHGGGWVHGDKQDFWDVSIVSTLVAKGFTVVSINYDLGPGSFPLNLYQCLNAVQYLRYNASKLQLNPDKISVMGASDGATLACLTGLLYYQQLPTELDLYPGISAETNVVVSLYAVTNMVTRVYSQTDKYHKAGSHNFSHMIDVLETTMCVDCTDTNIVSSRKLACADQPGGLPQEFHCLAQIWELASPALHAPPQTGKEILQTVPPTDWHPPAFLIIHGTSDTIVNYQQADELYIAIKAISNLVQIIKIPGAPHDFNLETDRNGNKLSVDIVDPIINILSQ